MLFPKADVDKLVQNYDMFRIDATKSFSTSDEAVTEVLIYPDYTNQPLISYDKYDIDPDCWYLDWAYKTEGSYKIRIELKTASASEFIDYDIESITSTEDFLFSDDSMIYSFENELKKYLPMGRNSWKYLHRKAQEEILDYFYRNGILNPDGSKILKTQLIGDSLERWSTFETILLIYQDIKTSNAEAFNEKIVDYSEKRADARKRYLIEYDSNKDGNVDEEDSKVATQPTFFHR
tara:strand:+ start:17968 stop:18672 length:705 start_codon:yes stop_codon:yes gene_type:complete